MIDKINICVVDDHNLFRKAIMTLLKNFSRIGEITDAENGKDFIDKYKKNLPHVILLDLEMPKMNGVETAEFLIPKYPGLKIIVLTQHDSESFMVHMLEIGVHSFLFKNTDPDELERAIHAVIDKDFYHNDLVAKVIRKSIMANYKRERPQFASTLTDREKEIVRCICKEMTYKEIGNVLSISEFTVRNHHSKILEKLNVKKTIGLVRYAYENGLTE